ncbi:glycerol-3-phosphate acyltransferase [Novisyntrophococcus fermenticellae]|uniref:glycerol-3-phosphate acyltransferase n=1 Tax=Novisyntrophococcus fermenticellae TaxID=2068655 RepID=UPI001E4F4C80|nr:glycerol-3-phosphate acyltransferase [Novisyntrophococcus fermenticellae]
MSRIICLIVGYAFGNLLTAELVVWIKLRKHPEDLGSGNPGMANVTRQLGIYAGILVLAGDILKTVLACLLCNRLFPLPQNLSTLYAGLGAILGHNFPVWKHFKGGKGVAVTCILLVLYSPPWGLAACIIGLLFILLTGYLPLGAVVIPTAFLIYTFLSYGAEVILLILAVTVLMFVKHAPGLRDISQGTCPKVSFFRH